MLSLFPQRMPNCQATSRRRFSLQVGSLTGLGLTLPRLLREREASAADSPSSADVNCILVWTRGGTSHHDTLDPKPDADSDTSVDTDTSADETVTPQD